MAMLARAADPAAEERARAMMGRLILAILAVGAVTGAIAGVTHGATSGVLALVHMVARFLLAAVSLAAGIVLVWFAIFGLSRP